MEKRGIKHKTIFKIKYPKFLLLILTFVLAYFLFAGRELIWLREILVMLGYVGVFIAGLMFSYGFTTAFAIAIFLIIGSLGGVNIYLAALLGGFGAFLSDYTIFKLIRTSFKDEIRKLEKEKPVEEVEKIFNFIPGKLKHYLIMLVAEIVIASPLPDEIGVAMLSIDTHISRKVFAVLSYTANTIGILVFLLIGRGILG